MSISRLPPTGAATPRYYDAVAARCGSGERALKREPDWAARAVDRFEVRNRHDFFAWVARRRLPIVATGDFHRPEHLATWKTVLPVEKSEEAVVDYLRSSRPVFLASFAPTPAARAA